VPAPQILLAPAGCFSVTWKVFRQSDNANMVDTYPSIFSISSAGLVGVTHSVTDFAQRNARMALLLSDTNYYFEGTLDDSASTLTSQFSFSLTFQDDCLNASIVP
jgi:hypothetical protein